MRDAQTLTNLIIEHINLSTDDLSQLLKSKHEIERPKHKNFGADFEALRPTR